MAHAVYSDDVLIGEPDIREHKVVMCNMIKPKCEITFETWLIHCHDIIKFPRTQVELSGHHVKIY